MCIYIAKKETVKKTEKEKNRLRMNTGTDLSSRSSSKAGQLRGVGSRGRMRKMGRADMDVAVLCMYI